MKFLEFSIPHDNNRLSFAFGYGDLRPWWRDLNLDGESLYRISNICDTCEMILEKSRDASLPLAPAEMGGRLRSGLARVDRDMVGTASRLLPKGDYLAALLLIQPTILTLKNPDKTWPDAALWENADPIRIPKNIWPNMPKHIPFWYGRKRPDKASSLRENSLYEAILPIVDLDSLNPQRVKEYEEEIKRGVLPTAMALSVIDARYLSGGKAFDWRLVHFCLDGHHKLMAASRLKAPISLLSFLSLSESFSPQVYKDQAIRFRYKGKSEGFLGINLNNLGERIPSNQAAIHSYLNNAGDQNWVEDITFRQSSL